MQCFPLYETRAKIHSPPFFAHIFQQRTQNIRLCGDVCRQVLFLCNADIVWQCWQQKPCTRLRGSIPAAVAQQLIQSQEDIKKDFVTYKTATLICSDPSAKASDSSAWTLETDSCPYFLKCTHTPEQYTLQPVLRTGVIINQYFFQHALAELHHVRLTKPTI